MIWRNSHEHAKSHILSFLSARILSKSRWIRWMFLGAPGVFFKEIWTGIHYIRCQYLYIYIYNEYRYNLYNIWDECSNFPRDLSLPKMEENRLPRYFLASLQVDRAAWSCARETSSSLAGQLASDVWMVDGDVVDFFKWVLREHDGWQGGFKEISY